MTSGLKIFLYIIRKKDPDNALKLLLNSVIILISVGRSTSDDEMETEKRFRFSVSFIRGEAATGKNKGERGPHAGAKGGRGRTPAGRRRRARERRGRATQRRTRRPTAAGENSFCFLVVLSSSEEQRETKKWFLFLTGREAERGKRLIKKDKRGLKFNFFRN
ncbi:uncharacterized protein EV154DRAFT_486593 [Mucor mucedo]|uniref:uncharacterized protein n=1 Tax=Mucor mucedo TaxID=29922 RepID=UPI00221E8708|nr:uncharacterized protein EV154DRAFT_486593 [Mucor mucedo]KAI7875921.1 hypothetical protein EV154DRAFT_486593 [Mucor mucedo]